MNSWNMAIIMALFGSAVAAAGLWGVMSPSGFLALASGWPSWGRVWIGTASICSKCRAIYANER